MKIPSLRKIKDFWIREKDDRDSKTKNKKQKLEISEKNMFGVISFFSLFTYFFL